MLDYREKLARDKMQWLPSVLVSKRIFVTFTPISGIVKVFSSSQKAGFFQASLIFSNKAAEFKTLPFLRNLKMGPIT